MPLNRKIQRPQEALAVFSVLGDALHPVLDAPDVQGLASPPLDHPRPHLSLIPEEEPLNVNTVLVVVADQEVPEDPIRPFDGLIQVLADPPVHLSLPPKT